ncbi:MAG TPA: YCF48-related protein [Candidatus Limnocylindria bacterium]|nr:YCF48-related protein [Candidatus Limnocylindria bacterium]
MSSPNPNRPPRIVAFLGALGAWLALSMSGCSSTNLVAPVLPPLSAVTLTPFTDTLQIGQTRLFTAVAFDTSGVAVQNATFQWRTSDPGIITVTAGRVRAVGEGSAWVLASAGGFSDSSIVSVFPDTGWFSQDSDANNADLNGVFFRPDGRRGWAVGAGGTVVHTDDAGAVWERQVSNTAFVLNAVWFTSDFEGWAVGANGTVLKTVNSGSTWTRLNNSQVNTGETLRDVTFASPDTGWAVGTNGVILHTFNRGASWQKVNPTANNLNSVSFTGTRDGWAVGDGGVILGTHDRGLSWFVMLPALTSQPLRSVFRRSEPLAWAVGQQGVTPRTSQPDTTRWELRNAGAQFQLQGVYYPTDLIGYAVGSNSGQGSVLRTDDGGLTWDPQISHASVQLNDVFFVDALRGWAVGDLGTIVHTARGGRQ